jgi:ubiquinone/menaquinone biosynthesis C-methylase UbiE
VIFDTNLWNRIRYTLAAPIYNGLAGWLKSRRRRSLALLDLQPGERVLLVGAGTGLDLDLIRPGPILTAIDLTPAMIKRLLRRARRRGLQVDARVMDAQALDFPDASFDVVILHFIVAVIPDPVRCAREAARVLRPGGRAAILDKFAPDGGKAPLLVRLVSPIIRILATEVTRQLGPILEGSGLRVVQEEGLGLHGMMKVVVVTK